MNASTPAHGHKTDLCGSIGFVYTPTRERFHPDACSVFDPTRKDTESSGNGPPLSVSRNRSFARIGKQRLSRHTNMAKTRAHRDEVLQAALFLMEAVIVLVLTRKRDSAVHIGSDITVKVLSIQRQQVSLGIEAPKSVRVWRDELAPLFEKEQQTHTGRPSAGIKIVLVVEDDPGHAKLIRKALCQSQGTMVTVAETAGNALEALGVHVAGPEDLVLPDLILLDLGLPDSSGLDVLRTIRSVPQLRTAPVVVLSCSDDESVMTECMEAGANAFVVKSSNYDDFLGLVRRIGQFWAGDCFARQCRIEPRGDDSLATLPRAVGAAGPDDRMSVEEAGRMGLAKTILLAEDDAGHATLIKRALTRANIDCTVDVVRNGVEAIDYLLSVGEYADRKPAVMPDLILLDLNMPEMDGRQVLQHLHNARTQDRINLPPVVVLTSSDEETEIKDAYSLGAQSFVRKPVQHGRFMEAVQQTTSYWLGLHESPNRDCSLAQPVTCPR